jgi:hypothetical protein
MESVLSNQDQKKTANTYRVERTGEVNLSLGQGHEMNTFDMRNSVGMKWTLLLCFAPATVC